MEVKIDNLVETSTVTIEISQLNPMLLHDLGFKVTNLHRFYKLPKHSVGVHHLTYYGSNPIKLQHAREIRDSKEGEFIRIKYTGMCKFGYAISIFIAMYTANTNYLFNLCTDNVHNHLSKLQQNIPQMFVQLNTLFHIMVCCSLST